LCKVYRDTLAFTSRFGRRSLSWCNRSRRYSSSACRGWLIEDVGPGSGAVVAGMLAVGVVVPLEQRQIDDTAKERVASTTNVTTFAVSIGMAW
jgi:hypothetical protein